MRALVGTSGYDYSAWKGIFYPETVGRANRLAYYATQFPAVEINYTFRKIPDEATVRGWASQARRPFRFALKAPQQITHMRRLKGAAAELSQFLAAAAVLRAQLGPILFQLPPNFKADPARLRDFVALLPRRRQSAFEFRHPSWFSDETFEILRRGRCALCVADTEDLGTPLVATAPFGYYRLRRENYSPAALRKWAHRIGGAGHGEAYVFFKHEDRGVGTRFARQLLAKLGD